MLFVCMLLSGIFIHHSNGGGNNNIQADQSLTIRLTVLKLLITLSAKYQLQVGR